MWLIRRIKPKIESTLSAFAENGFRMLMLKNIDARKWSLRQRENHINEAISRRDIYFLQASHGYALSVKLIINKDIK